MCLACQVELSDEEEFPPITRYQDGVFVVNRGNPFDGTSGSVSFYLPETEQIANDIYQQANQEQVIGSNLLQMEIYENLAYLLVADANKLEIVQPNTFRSLGAIGNLEGPQHFLPISREKAYLSQWGRNGLAGNITVIDLKGNRIEKQIAMRNGAGKMLRKGDFVYVVNSGGTEVDSVITKVNVLEDRVVREIEVGLVPNSVALDANRALWVLCQGHRDRAGSLVKIVDDQVAYSIEVSQGANSLINSPSGQHLLFLMDDWVYRITPDATELPPSPFIARTFTNVTYSPLGDLIYAAQPNSLQFNGQVQVFSSEGVEVNQFEAGVFPFGFWFDL